MDNSLAERKGLSANILKYIAIIAMTIDHIGWAFVPFDTVLGQTMHFIGRFTAPIMCYLIAEGYYYTKNVNKYLFRLGIFAVISHFPFVIAEFLTERPVDIINGKLILSRQLLTPYTSVFLTLFLGLLALKIWKTEKNTLFKLFAVFLICLFSCMGDWMFIGVLWILGFGINRGNVKKQLIFYYSVAFIEILFIVLPKLLNGAPITNVIWQAGLLFSPIFILFYNGKRGNSNKFNKWFFYIYYPLHLLIIGIIKLYLI